jgi:hypothetical protein
LAALLRRDLIPVHQVVIPKGLCGLDKEATSCKSQAAGWVYGHESFSLKATIMDSNRFAVRLKKPGEIDVVYCHA